MVATIQGNYRREAAASYLGLSLSTFQRLCKNGVIQGVKLSPKITYYKKEDLDALLKRQTTEELQH